MLYALSLPLTETLETMIFLVCVDICVFLDFFFFYLLEKERGRAGRRAERQGQVDSLLSGSREITGLYPRTSRS